MSRSKIRFYASYTSVRRQVPFDQIRRVWDAITRKPQAHVRDIAEELGIQFSIVTDALHILRDADYIAFERGKQHARTILIPFTFHSRNDSDDVSA